ncbi:MAG: cation:proton antiporter [Paludibacteraceae bacterium]|nr:cation:proton antiporter [Paludibacteraceae bacterium]
MISSTLSVTAMLLVIILAVPLVCKKLHIPAIAGLILTGLLVGPHGLNLLHQNGIIEAFSQIGILYVMFLSGVEIDINDFRDLKGRSMVFAVLTFLLPLAGTFLAGLLLGFPLWTSVLMASMMASHTLMTFPAVSRYNIQRNPAVSIVIGGTLFAVTGSLLTLALVSSHFSAGDSAALWWRMVIGSVMMLLIVFGLMPLLTRWFLRRVTDNVMVWSWVMTMAVVGGLLAKQAGIEPILGVFLTALALNKQILLGGPIATRISFVGNAIFIPIFLLSVGMLVDPVVFAQGWQAMIVAVVMIVVGIFTKWLAAWLTQRLFGLNSSQRQLMFGLTNSHAAGALATVMIGYTIMMPDGTRLIPETILNGTILLILVSCAVSSFVTDHAAKQLAEESATADATLDTDLMMLVPTQKTPTNRRPKDVAYVIHDGIRKMPEDQRVKQVVTEFTQDNELALTLLARPNQAIWLCHLLRPLTEYTRVRVLVPTGAEQEMYYAGWQMLLEKLAGQLRAEVTQEYVNDWKVLSRILAGIAEDELLIVVQARTMTPSYVESMSRTEGILKEAMGKAAFVLMFPAQNPADADVSLLTTPNYSPANSDGSFIRRLRAKWG